MKVCIVCYGLREENNRLQPWRYITEIAKGLIDSNIGVEIITDGAARGNNINSIPVFHIKCLRTLPFITNRKLIALIDLINPDIILWSVSPVDYLYMKTFKKTGIPIIGIFTGPIYKISDITKLGFKEIIRNFNFLSTHIFYAALPSFFLKCVVNSPHFKKIFVLSRKNKEILITTGAQESKIVHISTGIYEYDLINPKDCNSIIGTYGLDTHSFNILYFGSPVTIRGTDSLIKAISKVKKEYPHVKLIILSRRRGDELISEEKLIRNIIIKLNVESNVHIISGFLEKDDVKKFISFCNVVALPFKLVPSDTPTSILESMAMGKTVISTNIDGIPEMLEDGRGIVVEPNDENELTRKIILCITDKKLMYDIQDKSKKYISKYPKWTDISIKLQKHMKEVINEIY